MSARRLEKLILAALVVAGAAGAATAERNHRTRYLSAFEKEVLAEQNLARTDPKKYASYVEEWLQYYEGTMRHLPHRPYIRTIEGKRAVVEAVEFLEAQKPLPPLRPVRGLSRAARDHVADTGPKGWMGHVGSDDSEPGDRVSRYGRWYTRVGENISYGGSEAREIVIRLIVDDGIPERGHRDNIFNPQFKLAGVASGPHADYGTMCVITYAADFDEY